MPVTSNIGDLITNIQRRLANVDPDSPALKAAFSRIGILIQAQTKLNIRRQGIIDNGALLNSIAYKYFKNGDVQGVEVGSFGIKYAAINEFGGYFGDRQRRAMFAALRRKHGPQKKEGKGVIQGTRWRPRPYLRPAVRTMTTRVMEILREVMS